MDQVVPGMQLNQGGVEGQCAWQFAELVAGHIKYLQLPAEGGGQPQAGKVKAPLHTPTTGACMEQERH
jgi:hypothetical protein